MRAAWRHGNAEWGGPGRAKCDSANLGRLQMTETCKKGPTSPDVSKIGPLNESQYPERLRLDVDLPQKPPVDLATELALRQGHDVAAAAPSRFSGGH